MDIDEFLETETDMHKEGGRKDLVEKQSSSFISGRSIEGKIEKVRDLIQQKKFKEAENIYYAVKEQYGTLAKRQQDERRKIHRQLTQINKELIVHLNKVKGEMEQKGMVITDLLMKARQYMQQGNIEKANQLYLEVRRIFKQMPEAFGERKMMLENQILMFYSQLVNEFNRKKYDQLLGKREEIMRHVEMASNYVRMGRVEDAKNEYQAINSLYNQLPEGFLYEKTIIYKRILTLYQLIEEGNIAGKATMPPVEAMPVSRPMVNKALSLDAPNPNTQGPHPEKVLPTAPKNAAKENKREAIMSRPKKEEKKGFFSFMKKDKETKQPKLSKEIKKSKEAEMDAPPLPM
jgi:tetratricopeptide (TPR) repeat protein